VGRRFLADIIPQLEGRRGRDAVRYLAQLMVERVPLGEEGILPSDAAMFTWASVSPEVARRANRAERKRIDSPLPLAELRAEHQNRRALRMAAVVFFN
jgi:hypothetical protein